MNNVNDLDPESEVKLIRYWNYKLNFSSKTHFFSLLFGTVEQRGCLSEC